MKSDLIEAKAFKQASEKELEKLMIELHSLQLQNQKLKETNATGDAHESTTDLIQKRLEEEMQRRFCKNNETFNTALLQAELNEYKKENEFLKEQLVNLHSEVYGARLAAKYLDKELTGRIQQIQLFGKNLKPDEHERLWNQLEAEIHLHRHKTVIKACRAKKLKQPVITKPSYEQKNYDSVSLASFTTDNTSPPTAVSSSTKLNQLNEPRTSSNIENTITDSHSISSSSTPTQLFNQELNELTKQQMMNKIRTVMLKRKEKKEGLGISITGGSEHGLPILVSEIHPNGPAARSASLYVGDAILEANGQNLREVSHSDAVSVLTKMVNLIIIIYIRCAQ